MYSNMQQSVYKFSAYFFLYALLTAFIIAPIGLMIIGLVTYHFMLAMNNMTNLDSMGGVRIKVPCCDKICKQKGPVSVLFITIYLDSH